jgi:hypothetical protein
VPEEILAGTLHDVVNLLETPSAPVIGIRYTRASSVGVPFAEKMDSGGSLASPRQPADLPEVVTVHGDDVVESLQVLQQEPTALAGQCNTAREGGGGTAGVGWIAIVIPGRARGIDLEKVFYALAPDEVSEDALREWRSADITETDE